MGVRPQHAAAVGVEPDDAVGPEEQQERLAAELHHRRRGVALREVGAAPHRLAALLRQRGYRPALAADRNDELVAPRERAGSVSAVQLRRAELADQLAAPAHGAALGIEREQGAADAERVEPVRGVERRGVGAAAVLHRHLGIERRVVGMAPERGAVGEAERHHDLAFALTEHRERLVAGDGDPRVPGAERLAPDHARSTRRPLRGEPRFRYHEVAGGPAHLRPVGGSRRRAREQGHQRGDRGGEAQGDARRRGSGCGHDLLVGG
jgi:hypothetical protein